MTDLPEWDLTIEPPPDDAVGVRQGSYRGGRIPDGGPILRERLEMIVERGITDWVRLYEPPTRHTAQSSAGQIQRGWAPGSKKIALGTPGRFVTRYAGDTTRGVVWVKWIPPETDEA